ncbi:MAG: glycosyltransferase family 2 protein [Proteobacteria bacterium]|nr:glycosyltransferase family 2 protein [Pseudomonadota bacterium]
MHSASVIIPTYHRPKELRDCLESLLAQTVKPLEVIVVDDGNLEEVPFKQEFLDAGIGFVYHKKDRPGLTESRNAGIELAKGEIIFFLDDDVILFPDYLEQILSVYSENQGFVAGVGGLEDNKPPLRPRDYIKRAFELPFLAWGLREGKVLPSGFCTQFGESPFPLRKVTQVDFLLGGVSSYHRDVFREFSFTERYREYGLGEDKDFSVAVSRRHPLYLNPKARLVHLEATAMRPEDRRWARMFLMGTYLLFRRHMWRGWWSWPVFWYAVAGHFLARCLALLLFPNRGKAEKIKGLIDAVTIIAGRKAPDL